MKIVFIFLFIYGGLMAVLFIISAIYERYNENEIKNTKLKKCMCNCIFGFGASIFVLMIPGIIHDYYPSEIKITATVVGKRERIKGAISPDTEYYLLYKDGTGHITPKHVSMEVYENTSIGSRVRMFKVIHSKEEYELYKNLEQ